MLLLPLVITHWQKEPKEGLVRLLRLVIVLRQATRSLWLLVRLRKQPKEKRVRLLLVMPLKRKMKMQLQSVIKQKPLRVVLF